MITIHSCYENDAMFIIELSNQEELDNHWLYYDCKTGEFIRFWLRNRDAENEVAEYYFEQGFLKIKGNTAIFIEKFNFQQHTLHKVPVGAKALSLIEMYTGKMKSVS